MSQLNIQIGREALAEFCKRNHIRKLSLFGSVLRADFHNGSDVDFLVEFEAGYPVGYFDLAGMEIELSEILGRKADLRTPGELSEYFRNEVLAAAQPQYVSRRRSSPASHQKAAQKIRRFVGDRSKADVYEDEVLAHAVVNLLQVIGEAANHISEERKLRLPDIPWAKLIGTPTSSDTRVSPNRPRRRLGHSLPEHPSIARDFGERLKRRLTARPGPPFMGA
ncbi:MAG: nucleotidyltransferase domain-containing protein [Dehalococcoidia bacterium]